jgi:hypothetical protein
MKPGHPETYVVQPGDTLWSIAARFLNEPWRWPQVWQANPGVEPEPYLPGRPAGGGLQRRQPAHPPRRGGGGMRTVKLSPRVRVSDIDREIPAIPINAVAPFLSRPVVTEADRIDDAPYVVGFPDEKIVGGLDDTIFVRSILEARFDRWEVLRPGEEYRDPDTNELLGFAATSVATARLERLGDPATLVVTRSIPRSPSAIACAPPARTSRSGASSRPPPPSIRGKIISVLNGVSQIGQYDVVVLNRGARDGAEIGHVFEVFRGGEAASATGEASPRGLELAQRIAGGHLLLVRRLAGGRLERRQAGLERAAAAASAHLEAVEPVHRAGLPLRRRHGLPCLPEGELRAGHGRKQADARRRDRRDARGVMMTAWRDARWAGSRSAPRRERVLNHAHQPLRSRASATDWLALTLAPGLGARRIAQLWSASACARRARRRARGAGAGRRAEGGHRRHRQPGQGAHRVRPTWAKHDGAHLLTPDARATPSACASSRHRRRCCSCAAT